MPEAHVLLLSASDEAEAAAAALDAAGFTVEIPDMDAWQPPGGAPPALVLLDGRLPEGRAFALARELSLGPWSQVPLAWLGGPEDEIAALSVGATLFLGLPLDEDELVAHARALTESSQSRHRLEEGLSRLRAQEFGEAMDELGAAGTGLLGAWSRYHAGLARLECGDQQAAAEELHALLEERPSFWRAHVQLARLYRSAGFQYEAQEHERLARELRPDLHEGALGERRPLPEEALYAWSPAALPVAEGAGIEVVEDGEVTAEVVAPPTAEESRPLVLLADDSELALAMIGEHLESAGFRVITAADGEEAVERAREQRPDLVVLDGLMPGLNGFDACRRIKQDVHPEDPPPVILLSAIYTKQKQRTEAMSLYGADDLIPKSTDDAELLDAARRFLPRA